MIPAQTAPDPVIAPYHGLCALCDLVADHQGHLSLWQRKYAGDLAVDLIAWASYRQDLRLTSTQIEHRSEDGRLQYVCLSISIDRDGIACPLIDGYLEIRP